MSGQTITTVDRMIGCYGDTRIIERGKKERKLHVTIYQ
jgi:hypothetical protein